MNDHHNVRVSMFIVAAACICVASNAMADPVDFGDNDVPTRTLDFADDSDLGGRIAHFEGVVSDKGQRLIVKGLDVMSPMVIQVLAKEVAKPVDVSLHRYFWGKPDAEGSTGSDGDWAFRGRAHDEVGIALAVPESTPVYAFVWQGPPVPAAAAPTVVIDTNRQASEAGGVNLLTVAIVGLLAVIAVLLALQLLRRRPASAAMLIVATTLTLSITENSAVAQTSDNSPPNPFADEAEPAAADDVPNPFADEADKAPAADVPDPFADDQKPPGEEYKPEQFPDKPEDAPASGDSKIKPEPGAADADKPQDGGQQTAPDSTADSKLKPDPNSNKPNDSADDGNKLKPDPNADKPQTADSKLKPDPNADKPGDGDNKLKPDESSTADSKPKPDSEVADGSTTADPESDSGVSDGSMGESGDGAGGSFGARLEAAFAEIRQLRGDIASNAARISTLEFLINQDRDAVPAPGDGAPPIGFSCANDPDCQQCLATANGALSDLLVSLDKLKIIYINYIRYRDYMVGLGDSISGFHQLEQAAWYRTKLQIEEATIGLQRAYDDKFDEFKGRLTQSLGDLAACNDSGGDPTFTRESVLFENYVKAKYARDQ